MKIRYFIFPFLPILFLSCKKNDSSQGAKPGLIANWFITKTTIINHYYNNADVHLKSDTTIKAGGDFGKFDYWEFKPNALIITNTEGIANTNSYIMSGDSIRVDSGKVFSRQTNFKINTLTNEALELNYNSELILPGGKEKISTFLSFRKSSN